MMKFSTLRVLVVSCTLVLSGVLIACNAGCGKLATAMSGQPAQTGSVQPGDDAAARAAGTAIGGIAGGVFGGPAGAAAGSAIGGYVSTAIIAALGLFGLIRHAKASAADAKLSMQPAIDAAYDEGAARADGGSTAGPNAAPGGGAGAAARVPVQA